MLVLDKILDGYIFIEIVFRALLILFVLASYFQGYLSVLLYVHLLPIDKTISNSFDYKHFYGQHLLLSSVHVSVIHQTGFAL